ncbi:DUF348 domain-containing protein [Candidatus Saccharibacteria bacterium]|nr:DUF348 domain-containing protein [Candidatus Saccharibacteria bacterium]
MRYTHRISALKARFLSGRLRHFHHPVILAVSVFLVLVLIGGGLLFLGLHHKAKELTVQPNENYIVLLNVDGATSTLPTNADTVGQLLDKLDITLGKNDRVEPDRTVPITQDRFRVNVYRGAPVHIVDGVATYNTITAAATPRSMVTRAGVQLYPEDTVTLTTSDNFVLKPIIGLQAVVARATPVEVTLYGAPPVTLRTQTKTVGEFIKDKKIVITNKDTVKPALNTPIAAGMHIDVIRDGVHTITVEEDIAPPEETITDPTLSIGATAVRQAGSAGKRANTYEIDVQQGEEVSRKLLQSVTTVEPVKRVVVIGTAVYVAPDKTAVMAAAGISPSDYGAVDYIVSRESGWCPTKLQGTHVCPASAPAVIPSGRGYGLGQATPGTKMASAGADWATNPVTQLRWCTSYASRYGGWQGAYQHWIKSHWW